MIKKKRYITPYVDFSWIEEENGLLDGSINGSASGQQNVTDGGDDNEDGGGVWPTKAKETYEFEFYINEEY